MDNFRYAQLQNFSLAGSGCIVGAASITLKSMTGIDGGPLTMADDFGTIAFGTIEPGNGTLEEQICFTGLINNANGTVTLTGVSNVSFVYPYTRTSGTSKTHAGSTVFVISNTSGFYDELTSKADDEIVTGYWDFPSGLNNPTIGSPTYVAPTKDTQIATKKYVDDVAISGAPDASNTTKGITKLSVAAVSPTNPIAVGDNDARVPTQGENDALVGNNTDIAVGSGNKFVTQTGLQHSAEIYAADSGAADVLVVTLSPVPTSLTTGMTVRVKAGHANATTTPTLNVNGLGAKTIIKNGNSALYANDFITGQIVDFTYDGTNFQMESPVSNPSGNASGVIADLSTSVGGNNDVTVTTNFTPRMIKLNYWIQGHSPAAGTNIYFQEKGIAVFNGTSIVFTNAEWDYSPTTDNVGPLASAGANLSFNITTNSAGAPTIGDISTTNNGITLVLTINSVSATGFVIRRATAVNGTGSTARAKISYEAWA